MKHLVIGASGQDGTLLIAQLLSQGEQVISLSRKQGPLLGFDQIIGDVNNFEIVDPIIETYKPDKVYYLAAYHKSSEDQNLELTQSLNTNTKSFALVLDSLCKWAPQAHVVYASSCRIFGYGDGSLLTETSPLNPVCMYSATKACGMQMGKYYRGQKDLKVSTAILFNHESELRSANFISKKIILGALAARKDPAAKIEVMSLNDKADWGSARDYVRAMQNIANLDNGDDYIIASGHLRTVQEFAEIAYSAVGLNWENHIVETSKETIKWLLRGDPQKLKAKTKWIPNYTFDEMIEDMIRRTSMQSTQQFGSYSFFI